MERWGKVYKAIVYVHCAMYPGSFSKSCGLAIVFVFTGENVCCLQV